MAFTRTRHGVDHRTRPIHACFYKDLAKKWWDIGIRIEDDVLVTKEGHDVLSKDAPKSVEEIEEIMANVA